MVSAPQARVRGTWKPSLQRRQSWIDRAFRGGSSPAAPGAGTDKYLALHLP